VDWQWNLIHEGRKSPRGSGATLYSECTYEIRIDLGHPANLPALETVLSDIRRRGDTAAVYQLGDLVGYTPWPNEGRRASLGLAVVGGICQSHWLYWAVPVTGMIAAVRMYESLRSAHAPPTSRASVLGTRGPVPAEPDAP
jgi:hypothetical protein